MPRVRIPAALLLLSTAALCGQIPHVPDFARLPHRIEPLIQEGSANLLPSPGFEDGLEGWDAWGDVSLLTRDGEQVLRFGPAAGEEKSRIRVYIRDPAPGRLYLLRFQVKIPSPANYDGVAPPPELSGWLSHGGPEGALPGSAKIEEARQGDEWLSREVRLLCHPDANVLYILMGFSGQTGEALTRRWELFEEPVSANDSRVVLETPVGRWAEAPHPPQPEDPKAPVLWAVGDPDDLSPWTRPSPEDLRRRIELSGTPGEVCVAALGLFSPTQIESAKLTVSAPRSAEGPLEAKVRWRWLVQHPRRADYYGRGMSFRYVPDFMVDCPDGISCPVGQTTGVLLNLRLPRNAEPGVYNSEVSVTWGQAELSVPIDVRVYSFALERPPGKVQHIYLDSSRWQQMTDDQVLAELADVRDHGYESTSLGSRGEFTITDGRVTGFALGEFERRSIKLVLQAGLEGPFMTWGGWIPRELAVKLGLARDALDGNADTWPDQVTTAMVETLKLMKSALQAEGIAEPVLVLVDEPGYWKKGSPERMLWDVRTAKEAGWLTYCTSSELPSDPIGQGLDYHCYSGARVTGHPLHAGYVAEQTRAAGQKMWYYCTGAYSGQIGNIVRNRYLGGFLFFRTGAEGSASWTFQRPRVNAFDDFAADPRSGRPLPAQACITYPDPEHPGQNLDTLQWEGLRQAFYDHCYAATLRAEIQRARAARPEAANQAEKRLAELMESLPWNGDAFLGPDTSNPQLNAVRAQIAAEIITLQNPR